MHAALFYFLDARLCVSTKIEIPMHLFMPACASPHADRRILEWHELFPSWEGLGVGLLVETGFKPVSTYVVGNQCKSAFICVRLQLLEAI